jgi:hypothetical protein
LVGAATAMGAKDARTAAARTKRRDFFMGGLLISGASVRKMSVVPF